MSHYGTLDEAKTYFANRLYTDAWDDVDDTKRTKALTMSTNLINRLNFAGEQVETTQTFPFPRKYVVGETTTTQTEVPTDIEEASYELALALLDNDPAEFDPRIVTAKLGAASVTMDTSYLPEYITAGIPSKEAWGYLKPYLRDVNSISLERIN